MITLWDITTGRISLREMKKQAQSDKMSFLCHTQMAEEPGWTPGFLIPNPQLFPLNVPTEMG